MFSVCRGFNANPNLKLFRSSFKLIVKDYFIKNNEKKKITGRIAKRIATFQLKLITLGLSLT